MKSIKILILIILFAFSKDVYPLTYLGVMEGVGDPVLSVTGRALGMGNTSIASAYGIDAIFYNPANMLKVKRGGISLGLGINPVKETIETEDEPTNYSSAAYFEFSNIAIMYPLSPALRIGVGRRPVIDLNYKHKRNIYSAGELVETIDLAVDGNLNKIIIAFAAGVFPSFNIGFNYNIIGGGAEGESTGIVVESEKVVAESKDKLSGSDFELALNWEVIKDVLDVGFKWTSSSKIEDSWETKISTYIWTGTSWPDTPDFSSEFKGKKEYKYPSEIGVGLKYDFWERERSSLTVDIVMTNWKDLRYKEVEDTDDTDYKIEQDPRYRNTTRISVGIEHYLSATTVIRYGFTHLPHYSRTASDTTMFTAGIGFPATGAIDLDIAGSYGKRNFYGKNIFFSEDEMVDERIAKFLVSANWRF